MRQNHVESPILPNIRFACSVERCELFTFPELLCLLHVKFTCYGVRICSIVFIADRHGWLIRCGDEFLPLGLGVV